MKPKILKCVKRCNEFMAYKVAYLVINIFVKLVLFLD